MLKQILPSLRATLVLALFTGILFPLVITALSQVMCPKEANGSLIVGKDGKSVIGSELIGQSFTKPEYFHPRPSAAGSGYAGEASSGTNYGPTSRKLMLGEKDFAGIKQLAEGYRKENELPADAQVPVDAVTRSGSGLDPHISPLNAELQAARVAKARHISPVAVFDLLKQHTEGRQLGFLGEPRVNVLRLNLALDQLQPPSQGSP
jgi:K+-transporting ATPase ATPase C chain